MFYHIFAFHFIVITFTFAFAYKINHQNILSSFNFRKSTLNRDNVKFLKHLSPHTTKSDFGVIYNLNCPNGLHSKLSEMYNKKFGKLNDLLFAQLYIHSIEPNKNNFIFVLNPKLNALSNIHLGLYCIQSENSNDNMILPHSLRKQFIFKIDTDEFIGLTEQGVKTQSYNEWINFMKKNAYDYLEYKKIEDIKFSTVMDKHRMSKLFDELNDELEKLDICNYIRKENLEYMEQYKMLKNKLYELVENLRFSNEFAIENARELEIEEYETKLHITKCLDILDKINC